ncbi:MAG: hypothetical protein EPN60_08805 [Nevskiaceae bacterium]|nr:MAG: hypothetical protein EPO48_09560 [Nevskiaceae bacterium]TAM27166.1 MAG: hypothetical protein EPN60_08805 [Nevskiaceae bacterium]
MKTAVSRSHTAALLAALTLSACGGGSGGDAAIARASGSAEQQINQYSQKDQQRPVASGNAQGQGVVVWESFGQDGSHLGIYGRRLQNGRPVGDEFQVNTYTVSRQSFANVSMNAHGDFVAVWRSSLQGSPGGNIYAQRYAADGSRVGAEFLVGPDSSDLDSQSEPQVALADSGEFVVAFSNRELNQVATALGRNDLETRFVQLRIYDADGNPRTDPITASDSTADGSPRFPRVGLDASGKIVLIWINGTQVRARHYDLAGNALSGPYNVNQTSADSAVDQPSLAVRPDGRFAVAWEAFTYGNVPQGIQMQRYSAPQTTEGPVLTVASSSAGLIERSSLNLSTTGDYLLAAQAQDQTSLAVVDVAGAQRGPVRFSSPGHACLFPSVAMSSAGKALVAWQSFGQDGDGRGIYGREVNIP